MLGKAFEMREMSCLYVQGGVSIYAKQGVYLFWVAKLLELIFSIKRLRKKRCLSMQNGVSIYAKWGVYPFFVGEDLVLYFFSIFFN